MCGRQHSPSSARQLPPPAVARRHPAQRLSRTRHPAGKKAGAKRDAGEKPAAKEPKKAKKEPVEAGDVEMKDQAGDEAVVGSGRQAAQVRPVWADCRQGQAPG